MRHPLSLLDQLPDPAQQEPLGDHTPGPWVFNGGDHAPILHIYATDDKHVFHDVRPLPEQEANARLMAAAPELLAALKALLAELPNFMAKSGAVGDARAAVAKAEGR